MASPTPEIFFLLSTATNLPLAGATPTFSYYAKETGVAVTQPIITEIGGGLYKFTPTFTDLAHGICYVISGGALANPTFLTRYMRPEDYYADKLDTILQIETGKWEIKTSGPDANRLVLSSPDGLTVLYKFDLKDIGGVPTAVNPFSRVPV